MFHQVIKALHPAPLHALNDLISFPVLVNETTRKETW